MAKTRLRCPCEGVGTAWEPTQPAHAAVDESEREKRWGQGHETQTQDATGRNKTTRQISDAPQQQHKLLREHSLLTYQARHRCPREYRVAHQQLRACSQPLQAQ